MRLQQFRSRITTSATTTVVNQPCVVSQIYIAVADPGTTWKFKIQNKGTPVSILIPEVTLAAPALADMKPIDFDEPIFMDGGIDVVTTGGSPGEIALWIDALINQ